MQSEAFEKLLQDGTHSTLDEVFTVLALSFNSLLEGTFPSHDWNGKPFSATSPHGRLAGEPLANGFFGVVTTLVGDLDYLNKTLKLPHWARKDSPCAICRASGAGSSRWQNFSMHAEWKGTLWPPTDWMSWEGKSKCQLFRIKHLTGASVAADWMHTKYLGHDQYAMGSVIYILIFHLLNQGSTKRNLAWFWAALKRLHKTYQIRDKYGSFSTTTMFMNKQGIKLKGKAAVIKALAKPLLEIWSQWHNPQLQTHRMISIYLKLNCQIEGMLEDNFANLSFSSLDLFDSFKLCLLLLLYRFSLHVSIVALASSTLAEALVMP